MKQRIVYLAYPIDQAHGAPWIIQDARTMLTQAGVGWYDPGRAYGNCGKLEVGEEIEHTNRAALSRATGMLAVVPKGVPTIGVPREIERASRVIGMPVAVLSSADSWSLADVPVWPETAEGLTSALIWLLNQEYSWTQRRTPLTWTGVCNGAGGQDHDGPKEHCPVHGTPEDREFVAPRRAYEDDAGYDLTVARDTWISVGEAIDVPTGIAIELPRHQFGMIVGRSSARRTRGLTVHTGIIDPGWRGELFVQAECIRAKMRHPAIGRDGVLVQAGERIGQLLILGNSTQATQPVRVERLSDHPRGHRGFGSSGR